MNSVQAHQAQRGFTLVELLLVILVLSSLALGASFLVDGFGDQTRFDDTKSRLQQIRKAIIGDASRTLNGQSEISGYVADMGKLPETIQELIEIGDQPSWGLSAVTTSDISPVVTILMSAGWRGPYLDTLPESDGQRRFRDGWGNGDLSDVDFGWVYSADVLTGVSVQSLGANGVSEVTPENVFDADYPIAGYLVEPNDYEVSLNNLSVQLNKPIVSEPSHNLVLRLYFVSDGAVVFDESLPLTNSGLIGQQTLPFTFNEKAYLGSYAALLLCDSDPVVVYDGDCVGPHNNNYAYIFTLIPRTQLPLIPWNIQ